MLFSLNPFPTPQAKEGADQDSRKSFTKRGSKTSDATDFPSGTDAQLLDPISEEDEKLDHSTSSRNLGSRKNLAGSCYHKLSNDEDSGPEEADNTTPLLQKEERAGAQSSQRSSQASGMLTKPGFLSDILLDQKDSSDSGMRSSDSSSLEDAEREAGTGKEALKPNLIELELEGLVKKRGLLPSSLSELQDTTVARMSICSEAPSEVSLMASSPDEGWTSSGISNLNRTDSNTTLNNNTNDTPTNSNTNNSHQQQANIPGPESTTTSSSSINSSPAVIITPGSSSTANTTTASVHHNQNLRSINLGDERESVL